MATVREMGCLICGRPASIHHVRRGGAKKDDFKVLPLCEIHHQYGPPGVAIHAGRESWETNHGTEAHWLREVERRLA